MDVKQAISLCRASPEQLRELDPHLFEAVVAELLAGFGWEVSVTPPTRDGGYDILGITTDSSGLQTSWVVECKRYAAGNKVGVEIARQIVGVKAHIGVPNAVLVTTSSFTADVHELSCARRDLHLVDLARLAKWLQKYSQPSQSSYTAKQSFSSCFISHSSKDQAFAQKLAARLRTEGVPVWFAPDDIMPGEKIYDQVKHAISSFDRLLVVLSEHSMKSNWVQTELANALAREHREGGRVLFPVSVVPIDVIREWECFDADSGIDIAKDLRSYHIPDFSNWSDPAEFDREVTRVISALRGGPSGPAPDRGTNAKAPELIFQKRISATETLWSAVLDLKQSLSSAVFFYTILLPSEYDSVFEDHGNMHDVVSSITDDLINDAMTRANEVERCRPYLSEVLWSHFFVYRAFLGRLATLIVMGKRHQHIENWRNDGGIKQILGCVFREQDFKALLGGDSNPHAIGHILDRLQSLMLAEINRVSSAT
ncbi:MAG TPA: restriction endonuclease [Terriglobales bacterium]|nr:restriction endonuclease [Terriglobales bacterium]